jgi:hypothetical protein
MNRLLLVALLAAGLLGNAAAKSAENGPRSCAGLDYSCEQLVELGFTYPFSREPGSYLFINGAVYPYRRVTERLLEDSIVGVPDGTEIPVRELLSTFGLETEAQRALLPVVGYGSDPAPAQLRRKYLRSGFRRNAVIPVIKGRLRDYDVVWSPFFVGYGAMPSTIAPSPGTDVEIWVTWLDHDTVRRMNASEGAGELYAFGSLRDVRFDLDGPRPKEMFVYVACYGALEIDGRILALAPVPASGRSARPVDSSAALRAVLPKLGWQDSVLDLLCANIRDPAGRAERTRRIKDLGVMLDDPHFHPEMACGSRTHTGGGRF